MMTPEQALAATGIACGMSLVMLNEQAASASGCSDEGLEPPEIQETLDILNEAT